MVDGACVVFRPYLFYFMVYLIIIGVIILAFIIYKTFKFPKLGSMCMITGGVKTGKSTFAVSLAVRNYKKRLFTYKVRYFFCKLLRKPFPVKPLLYSNVPLKVPFVPLTKDLLTRQTRFAYGSVIYVCEASLVADSQMIKDKDLNEALLMFNKLIGHESKGGLIIYDTQCIGDVHYSIKRCLSEYFYIHHLVKWIPGFLVAYIKEDRYSDDGTVITTSTDDVEDNLKRVIIPKSTWKLFDCYCYSSLTDYLPVEDKVIEKVDSLKANNIISFKDSRRLKVEKKES